jgi:hypothetical protein
VNFSEGRRRREIEERIVLSDGRGFEDNVAAALILEAARRSGRGLALP